MIYKIKYKLLNFNFYNNCFNSKTILFLYCLIISNKNYNLKNLN